MSVQAVNQLLGPGMIYVKRTTDADGKYRLIGSVKEATFQATKEEVEQKPGDMTVATRRDKIEEKATLKCKVVDFRLDQMIAAFGLSISRTQLTLTSSVRIMQEMTFASTSVSKSLSHTAKSMTSVAATSLDRSTDYVAATDYTMTSTKKIKPKLASFWGGTRRVFYTALHTTSKAIRIGGNELLQNVSIMYVHKKSNGKHIAIQFGIATVQGDLSFEFKEKDYTVPEITFAALGDPTKPKGQQLFKIIEEQ